MTELTPAPSLASIIVPTLNEAAHITPLLQGLLTQAPESVLEILVVDGGSTDGTRGLVEQIARRDARVRLLHNPRRIQAAGVNLGARAADPRSEVLIRVDAHGAYPPDYIPRLLSALRAHKADSVVVRLCTVGAGCFGRGVAAACNGLLGTGGAAHRMGMVSGFVDHGHHAAFNRAAYEGVGGYDENFRTNEDAELDVRLRKGGARIWFAADIEVEYHPRESARALARQYFRYGCGRAANAVKHRGGLRCRQLAPLVLLLGLLTAVLWAPAEPTALLAPGVYLTVVAAMSAYKALQARSLCVLGAAVAAPVMHLSWAAGFLTHLLERTWRSRLPDGRALSYEAEG